MLDRQAPSVPVNVNDTVSNRPHLVGSKTSVINLQNVIKMQLHEDPDAKLADLDRLYKYRLNRCFRYKYLWVAKFASLHNYCCSSPL